MLLYFQLVFPVKFQGLHKVLGQLVYGIVIIVSVRELWAVLRMGPCIIYKKNEFRVLSRNENVSLPLIILVSSYFLSCVSGEK